MEPAEDTRSVTQLLRESRLGGGEASEQLVSLVYDKLHVLAAQNLRSERTDHTLQPTALVHEAWLRLAQADIEWQDRVHFYKVAARLMRRILVDYARAGNREKRGGRIPKIALDDALVPAPCRLEKVLMINEALDRLGSRNGRHRDILELMIFGGLTYEETGAALDLSPGTVHREMKLAKAWLQRELTAGQAAGA
ncbi:MAG TPA: ECF-type sigma factor [Bryobacteraceae bacterium]